MRAQEEGLGEIQMEGMGWGGEGCGNPGDPNREVFPYGTQGTLMQGDSHRGTHATPRHRDAGIRATPVQEHGHPWDPNRAVCGDLGDPSRGKFPCGAPMGPRHVGMEILMGPQQNGASHKGTHGTQNRETRTERNPRTNSATRLIPAPERTHRVS